MKKIPSVSIVIPVYQPEKEVFSKLKEMLKKQTIKAEIIENWNMPEAKSMNTGIRKAKGEIIVTLAQDCIPEDKFWLEKLIKPLEDKQIVGTISDLYLPERHWDKYDFLTKMSTISERKDKKNGMDMRACAFRKKDLLDAGLITEDPKVIGIDGDIFLKLSKKGKFIRAEVRVAHLHKQQNFNKVLKKIYVYSEGNGKFVRGRMSDPVNDWIRIIKAFPCFGLVSIIYGFPFKRYSKLFIFYLVLAVPIIHIMNVIGFWKGFFLDRESMRNLEVLNKKNHLL